jgi:hypothetical protein
MIGIVDYRAGNLTSVTRALENLHEPCIITHDCKLLDIMQYYSICCDKISLTYKTAFRILNPRKSNFLSIQLL